MADDEKRVTVRVSREVHSKAKAKAALQGLSLSDVVRDLLGAFIADRPKRRPKGEPIGEAKK